jgi:anti-sigma factor RsiW
MKRCWLEGDWRAYYDRELPSEEMAAGGRHLEECPACAGLYREVSERAARVAGWLREIDAAEVVACAAPVRLARRRRWVAPAAAAGIAAVLLLGVWLWPGSKGSKIAAPAPRPAVVAANAPPAAARPASPVRAQGNRRRLRQPLKPTRVDYYMALDDEPLESGVVVRMALNDSGSQADVLFDAMGRPRAVRPVN